VAADALLDVIEQLQGAAIPASELERDVLPARLPGYRAGDLDQLCAAGEVVWVGVGPLGERDGRVAPHHRLAAPPARAARGWSRRASCTTRCARTSRDGASFFAELHAAAGGGLARPRWTRCGTSSGPAR
jgi:ATP-dependent Lhr-like helicase